MEIFLLLLGQAPSNVVLVVVILAFILLTVALMNERACQRLERILKALRGR